MKPDWKTYIKEYQKSYYREKKRFTVTVSKSEYAKLEKLSKKEGKKPSALFKEFALRQMDESYYIPLRIESKLAEFVRSIRGIANNINQIAHNTNISSAYFSTEDFFSVLKSLEDRVVNFVENPYRQ